MCFVTTSERGPSRRVQQESCETPPTSVTETIRRLDGWYESGIPFFTRESIQYVSEQLQCRPIYGDKIFIKGIDGVTVQFDVLTGEIRAAFREELEFEFQSPFVSYHALTHLKESLQDGYIGLHEAYCSLQIEHWTSERNKSTKELVYDFPIQSYRDVNNFFEVRIRSWEESVMCKQLEAVLTSATTCPISKVIAFACGPLSLRDQFSMASHSAFQHALLLTLRNWLIDGNQSNICCYAQDPVYTEIDKAILKDHNIEVLEDPQALLEVDDSSIVFACAPDIPLKEIVADLARPAMLIWDRVTEIERRYGVIEANPDSPRVRAMIEHYDQYEFGPDREHFSDLVIYIRKTPN